MFSHYKKHISQLLNILIFISALLGVILACVFATRDGYSHWYKRLWYFTQQSNLWIAAVSLIFTVINAFGNNRLSARVREIIYLLKFIFTVSITVTAIIFCSLLAPFADFNIWQFSSVLTHVVVPLLSILDFFLFNSGEFILKLKHAFLSLIPPIIYFVFAGSLCLMKVDFGRGDPYPYFFMDFYSEVGIFGFEFDGLPQLGAFYWIIIFIALILCLSIVYIKLYNRIGKAVRNKENSNTIEVM